MSRYEQRYKKLKRDGFLPSEAEQLARHGITSAEMRAYRRERRAEKRAAKEMGLPRRAVSQQIRAAYTVDGFIKGRKLQALERFSAWVAQQAPRVVEAARPARRVATPLYDPMVQDWMNAGFLFEEAIELAESPQAAELWNHGRAMRDRRRETVRYLKRRGWSNEQIMEMFQRALRRTGVTPFDFFRAEYRPTWRRLKDYSRAAAARAAAGKHRAAAKVRRWARDVVSRA